MNESSSCEGELLKKNSYTVRKRKQNYWKKPGWFKDAEQSKSSDVRGSFIELNHTKIHLIFFKENTLKIKIHWAHLISLNSMVPAIHSPVLSHCVVHSHNPFNSSQANKYDNSEWLWITRRNQSVHRLWRNSSDWLYFSVTTQRVFKAESDIHEPMMDEKCG